MAPRVIVVGPPGSGKTTVGTLVAAQLGVDFRDTDADIEAEAGQVIPEIFVEHGETHFRKLERAAVVAALESHEGVLALGGGAVLDPDTRADLAAHTVVLLEVGLADAVKREGLGVSRPLLFGNVRGRLKQLMEERRPLYEAVATVIVDTDGRTPEEVAAAVLKEIGQ
jgi:shikimate kinase